MGETQAKTSKKAKAIYRAEDFANNERVAAVRNITASTELPKGRTALIVAVEEKAITLIVPSRTVCAVGHVVVVRFFDRKNYERVCGAPRSVQEKAQILSVNGKVTSVEHGPDESSVVECELQQFNAVEWQKFRDAFAESQGNVSKLTKRLKS